MAKPTRARVRKRLLRIRFDLEWALLAEDASYGEPPTKRAAQMRERARRDPAPVLTLYQAVLNALAGEFRAVDGLCSRFDLEVVQSWLRLPRLPGGEGAPLADGLDAKTMFRVGLGGGMN